MKLSSKLRNTRFLLATSVVINLILLLSWLGSIEVLQGSHQEEMDEVYDRAIKAEIQGKDALLKVKESGEKVYEFERLLVSEKAAMEDLKKRYEDDAKRYKRVISHLNIKLEAKVDSIFMPAEPMDLMSDSEYVCLPQRVSYRDGKWMTFRGTIEKKDGKLGLMIEEMLLMSGNMSIDDVTKKGKWYQFKKPQPMVRISIESPYYSMLSAQDYKVDYKPRRNLGLKILTHAAAFAAGVYLVK